MEQGGTSGSKLSDREAQTLTLAADGLTDKEIAVRLDISTATIRTYWDRIRTKLGATNRAQAIALALGKGYTPGQPDCFQGSLSSLAKSNTLGVAIIDLDGKVLDANDAYLEMTGYSRDDLKKGLINWHKMTPHEFDARDAQAKQEMLTDGMSAPYEKDLITKSGDRIRVRRAGALIQPPNEAVSYVVSLSTPSAGPHAAKVQGFGGLVDCKSL